MKFSSGTVAGSIMQRLVLSYRRNYYRVIDNLNAAFHVGHGAKLHSHLLAVGRTLHAS